MLVMKRVRDESCRTDRGKGQRSDKRSKEIREIGKLIEEFKNGLRRG